MHAQPMFDGAVSASSIVRNFANAYSNKPASLVMPAATEVLGIRRVTAHHPTT